MTLGIKLTTKGELVLETNKDYNPPLVCPLCHEELDAYFALHIHEVHNLDATEVDELMCSLTGSDDGSYYDTLIRNDFYMTPEFQHKVLDEYGLFLLRKAGGT